jgi:uncharacterized MnhB-related membrane protein
MEHRGQYFVTQLLIAHSDAVTYYSLMTFGHNVAMRFRPTPVLAIFLAGLVYSLLPRGIFGAYDVAMRSAICGATAASAALILGLRHNQSDRASH